MLHAADRLEQGRKVRIPLAESRDVLKPAMSGRLAQIIGLLQPHGAHQGRCRSIRAALSKYIPILPGMELAA